LINILQNRQIIPSYLPAIGETDPPVEFDTKTVSSILYAGILPRFRLSAFVLRNKTIGVTLRDEEIEFNAAIPIIIRVSKSATLNFNVRQKGCRQFSVILHYKKRS